MIKKETIAKWIKDCLYDCDYIEKVEVNGSMIFVETYDGDKNHFIIFVTENIVAKKEVTHAL